MADISVTAAQVGPVGETEPEIKDYTAAVAINAGQWVYVDPTTGKVNLARANSVNTSKVIGRAMISVGAGQIVPVLSRGSVGGDGLSGLNYGATVYLSAATAGAATDTKPATTGQVVVPLGSVTPMNDSSKTKCLFVDIPFNADYTALP